MQQAIFDTNVAFATHLEYRLLTDQEPVLVWDVLKRVLSVVPCDFVVAFGDRMLEALAVNDQPEGYEAFSVLESSNGYQAPDTQGDLWLRLQGQARDIIFDAVMAVNESLSGYAELLIEQPCFSYHGSQDLIGFEDGTANPKTADDRHLAACIPSDKRGAGGSFVLTQRWVHKLEAFKALSDDEQSRVVGRDKHSNEELSSDQMPVDSHVSKTDLSDASGRGIKVWRRSMPFGTLASKGLYFVSYASVLSKHKRQLESMYGLDGSNSTDRLLSFSAPNTGAFWFAPSEAALSRIDSL